MNARIRLRLVRVVLAAALLGAGIVGVVGSSGAAAAKAVKFATPFKIAGFFDIAGQDPQSDNGNISLIDIAINYLNSHGGVGGRKVEFKLFEMTYNPSTAQTGFLQALAWKPSVVIGIDASTVLVPLEQEFAKSKVPVLALTTDLASQSTLKYPNNLFTFRGAPELGAAATTQYLVNKFKPTKVGLICVSSPYGTANCNADQIALIKDNVTVVNRVTAGITSTDESTEAQAMLGANLVLDEGFPGPIQLDIEAMTNEGLVVPVSASASVAYATAGLTPAELALEYGFADCVPQNWTSQFGKQIYSEYEAKMNNAPMSGFTAHIFDATLMAAKAAELAKSPSPAKIGTELRTMKYVGLCSTYQSLKGGSQIMVHQAEIVQPTPTGGWTVLQTVPEGTSIG